VASALPLTNAGMVFVIAAAADFEIAGAGVEEAEEAAADAVDDAYSLTPGMCVTVE